MTAVRERLIDLLVESKLLTKEKLEEALKIQKEKKGRIGDILIKLGYISKENIVEVLSAELGMPVIRLSRYKVQGDVLKIIPRKMAELHCVLPVSKVDNIITLAMADPMNIQAIDDIKRQTGFEVRTLLTSEKDICEAIVQYYEENVSQTIQDMMKEIAFSEELQIQGMNANLQPIEDGADLVRLTEEEPIVKLTNSVLTEAVIRRASDIFIEPEELNLRVRYRVDGLLQEGVLTHRSMHSGVVSRLKVMSHLDIAEHRVPQDGRFKIRVKEKEVDFRVSVLPTFFGEKVVLRVLDKGQTILDLEKLGFEPEPMEALKKSAMHPHGMILTCGPTGSGKTTTLYSVLRLIDKPDVNIVTVEDPVEFEMYGINQVSVRSEVNLTFATSLRSILRQDPDIIMVGEIRDSETADVAIKAALTGHLVLSTLHATTAVGSITRLLNMGIEPFLITSSVLLAGSQRLVRKICEKCREGYEPTKEMLAEIGITDAHLAKYGVKKPLFYRGKGCDHCHKKGYWSRAVLLEALTMTPEVKALILDNAPEYKIKDLGCKQGLMTLRENGIAKILKGVTTPEEVTRVTVRDQGAEE